MDDKRKTKKQLIDELAQLRRQLAESQATAGERNETEDILQLYEHIVSVTTDRLAFIDENYIYRAANLSYSRACNKTHDEVLGHTITEVLGAEVFENFVKGYIDRCLAGESVHYQSWFDSPVTGRNYLDVQYQPYINSDGKVLGVVVSSRDITDRKYAEESRIKQAAALARSEELQHSRQRIIAEQESMRKRLADQLHGTIQTRMILILHRLAEIKNRSDDRDTANSLDELSQDIENLLELDIRSFSHQLYPSILRQGLILALQTLSDQLERELSIELRLDEELVRQEQLNHQVIPEMVKLSAYRIIEESLNNVIKHSHATGTVISLEYFAGRRLQIKITDSGAGFDTEKTPLGFGLAALQSYADIVGGSCSVQSTPGRGTTVTAMLPLQSQEPPETEL